MIHTDDTLEATLLGFLGLLFFAWYFIGCGAPAIERISTPATTYALKWAGCDLDTHIYAYDPDLIQKACAAEQPVYGCARPTFIKIEAGLSEEMNCQVVAHECLHIKIHEATGDWDYNHINPLFTDLFDACKVWEE